VDVVLLTDEDEDFIFLSRACLYVFCCFTKAVLATIELCVTAEHRPTRLHGLEGILVVPPLLAVSIWLPEENIVTPHYSIKP
jgi:hypothetical protein